MSDLPDESTGGCDITLAQGACHSPTRPILQLSFRGTCPPRRHTSSRTSRSTTGTSPRRDPRDVFNYMPLVETRVSIGAAKRIRTPDPRITKSWCPHSAFADQSLSNPLRFYRSSLGFFIGVWSYRIDYTK